MPRLLAELHQAFTGDSMQEAGAAFPGGTPLARGQTPLWHR